MVTLPATTPVQFGPPPTGTFTINTFADPSGNPSNVIDIDLGATLDGKVILPGDLTGTGHVNLAADEIGGPFHGIVKTVSIVLTGNTSTNDSTPVTYPWTLTFKVPDLPDESRAYHFALTFVVTNPGSGHTDIAAIVDLGDIMVV
jgi:hypothetical protein